MFESFSLPPFKLGDRRGHHFSCLLFRHSHLFGNFYIFCDFLLHGYPFIRKLPGLKAKLAIFQIFTSVLIGSKILLFLHRHSATLTYWLIHFLSSLFLNLEITEENNPSTKEFNILSVKEFSLGDPDIANIFMINS